MSDLYLYHATDKKNLESIKKTGLLINPPSHAWEKEMNVETLKGKIFLALNATAAIEYMEELGTCPKEIVILKVDLDCLNQSSFGYDWNNRCEYYKDINSCIYMSDIPSSCLQECSVASEPDQDIWDFEGTDMFETIMCTFEEECETNLEHEDEDYDENSYW